MNAQGWNLTYWYQLPPTALLGLQSLFTRQYPLSLDNKSFSTLPASAHMDSTPNTSSSPSPSQFTARPFPPPALTNVPVEYIMDQLHNLAPHYWNRPETADCTIIIPVPHHSPSSSTNPSIRFTVDPNGTGRRATAPDIDVAPRMALRLHMDYLSAKSSFLRGLFSGASPLDLVQSLHISGRRPSGPLRIPQDRLPRLLPSTPSHPIVFLPVPDPSSIHVLFHWMYFGDTDHIETCLDQGVIQWEGLARNVEYLGVYGRWYGDWLLPAQRRSGCAPCTAELSDDSDAGLESDDQDDDNEDDDDDDEEEEEEETDCDDYFSTSSSHTDEVSEAEQCERGRTRGVRPLARLCGQLQLCTA
ncbi:hypothetical protein BU15DRAFT_85137 [Melanogaster broomeanus]|nr:hypothetical protein BU15DRAFT_85137 [Melanogaster broomeanus]